MKRRRRNLKLWTYEEEIYLLTTEDDRSTMADKLKRSLPSISSKLGRLKKMEYTREKLIKERQFIIDNHDSMTILAIADKYNISEVTMHKKIEALRNQGLIGYKQYVEPPKSEKIKVVEVTKPYYPKNCIRKFELYKLNFKPKELIMANGEKYKVIKDYGLYILCEKNGIRECFNKVDFKIENNTLEVM